MSPLICPKCGKAAQIWRRRYLFFVGCTDEECDYEGPNAYSIPEALEYWDRHIVEQVMQS